MRVGLDKYPAQGLTPAGIGRTLDPGVVAGSLERFGATGVAVSRATARAHGLRPGDPLRLTLGDGTPVTLTVAAVYARALGFGDVILPHELVARHVDNPLSTAVLVAAQGVGRGALAAAVRGFPGVQVLTPDRAVALTAHQRRSNAEAQFLAMALVLVFTAIAAVNSLAMSTTERAPEFTRLRLAGATRRQVLRMLCCESLAVLTLAVALGTAIALAVLTSFSTALTGAATPTVAPLPYLGVLALTAALALPATAVSGRLALAGTGR